MTGALRWLLTTPRRVTTTLALVVAVSVLVSTLVVAVRVRGAAQDLQARADRTITGTGQTIADATGATGAEALQPVDPRPTAVTVVTAWAAGDVDALAAAAMPGMTDALLDEPAPEGLAVTGDATVVESGPTLATVAVPTTAGTATLSLISLGPREWRVQTITLA